MNAQPPNKYSISVKSCHLVLLGAGASLAAFPNGENNGLKLPLMDNFVETITGLSEYFSDCGIDYKGQNFEDLYSDLYEESKYNEARKNIEELIYDYFTRMELPEEPTLYDHLVLSLTGRDVIATFNWGPFLWQAVCRNVQRVGDQNRPLTIYLHGNTGIGVCKEHQPVVIGVKGQSCSQCGRIYQKSNLLFPITQKDYINDLSIKMGWDVLKKALNRAYMFTIFGYSAPKFDVEAIELLKEGWGKADERRLEQIQMIDIIQAEELEKRWGSFIHSTHYGMYGSIYNSFIGRYSRRSCDALWDATMMSNPRSEYRIPLDATWDEIDEWLKPLLEMENKARESA